MVACKKARGSHHRFSQHPAFPARWLYGLYVISPGTGVLAPVDRWTPRVRQPWSQHRETRTTRFHRPPRQPSVRRHQCVHRNPPRDLDDAFAPLVGRDGIRKHYFPKKRKQNLPPERPPGEDRLGKPSKISFLPLCWWALQCLSFARMSVEIASDLPDEQKIRVGFKAYMLRFSW